VLAKSHLRAACARGHHRQIQLALQLVVRAPPLGRRAAMQKVRIVRFGFGTS
jgi:hypothetical protein